MRATRLVTTPPAATRPRITARRIGPGVPASSIIVRALVASSRAPTTTPSTEGSSRLTASAASGAATTPPAIRAST